MDQQQLRISRLTYIREALAGEINPTRSESYGNERLLTSRMSSALSTIAS